MITGKFGRIILYNPSDKMLKGLKYLLEYNPSLGVYYYYLTKKDEADFENYYYCCPDNAFRIYEVKAEFDMEYYRLEQIRRESDHSTAEDIIKRVAKKHNTRSPESLRSYISKLKKPLVNPQTLRLQKASLQFHRHISEAKTTALYGLIG